MDYIAPPTPPVQEIAEDEPYIGNPMMDILHPTDVIELFIESINNGDFDQAIYLIEPNYLTDSILDPNNDFYNIVKLWNPGELESYKITVPSLNYVPLPCRFTVILKSGQEITYDFELVESINGESSPPSKEWQIQNMKKDRNSSS